MSHLAIDGLPVTSGEILRHTQFGPVEVCFSEGSWHYLRMGCAGVGKDTENLRRLSDTVPVTRGFLALVGLLHAARAMFINEKTLAEEVGQQAPVDYWTRCEHLFYRQLAREVMSLRFASNAITFEAIMRLTIPSEVSDTRFVDLPSRYAFNPWRGLQRLGKIWWIADSHDEAQRWRMDYLGKGAVAVELKPQGEGSEQVDVIITLVRDQAKDVLGLEVGAEEWLEE